MKIRTICYSSRLASHLLGVGLALSFSTQSAEPSATLKESFKNHFLIGTAISRNVATSAAGRRSQELVNKDVALVKAQFNQISPENDLKWQLVHPREGADGYDFSGSDAFVNFGVSNNMYIVGHTLVWHSQTPNWVFTGTNPPPAEVASSAPAAAALTPPPAAAPGNGNANTNANAGRGGGGRGFGGGFGFGAYNGPRASRDELLQRMRDHIHTVVGRYKGKIKSWDVVNEAIADGPSTNYLRNSLWLQIIGPDFIAKAFQYAHEADPDAVLRYNDYGLENPVKRQKLIKLIKSLQEQKVPVHAIGSQAHLNVSITYDAMDSCLTELASLGLPIHITELDVNSAAGGQRGFGADVASNATTTQGGLVDDANRKLTEAYTGIFKAFVKHKSSLKVITFWGPNDANSWRAQGKPLLFDSNADPKPAFEAVLRTAGDAAGAKQ